MEGRILGIFTVIVLLFYSLTFFGFLDIFGGNKVSRMMMMMDDDDDG